MPFVKCPECGKLNSVKHKNCPKCEASLEIVRMSPDNTQPAGGFNPGVPQPPVTPWGQPAQQPPMPRNNPWGQPAQQQNTPWGGQPVQPQQQPARTNPWGQPAQQTQQPQGNPWGQPVQPQNTPWGGQPAQQQGNPWGQPAQPQNNPWGGQAAQTQGNPWGGQPAAAPNNAPSALCPNCGTQLMPGARFCGNCGQVVAQQPAGIPTRKNPYCK